MVHLYEEYGPDMVLQLRGMFAFAIYDSRRKHIFLGRDRFGIKPLYYTFIGEELAFASEMKAILALSQFEPQIDRQACYDFFGLSYIPESATGYSNIWMVPKGHSLSYRGGIPPVAKPYWRAGIRPNPSMRLEEAIACAEETLSVAVQRYVVADVPVAALLSGGIDSSLVVSAYRRQIGEPLRTFNVRFPDRKHDETRLAIAVARQYGTDHVTIDVKQECITGELALRLLNHFDQPFADTSLIPMYLVSEAIHSQGIICTLSGDGGDEVFAGYDSFWRVNKLATLGRLPRPLQNSLVHLGRCGQLLTQDLGRQVRKAMELADAGKTNTGVLLAGLANYLTETQKEELVLQGARVGLAPIERLFTHGHTQAAADLEELSYRLTENLFEVGLPSDMLRKVDMMSMLAGIEVRVPFLDEDVVQLGLSLPHRLKTDGRRGKLVLRALASRWLTPEVVNHPKHGFTIPLDTLLTDSFSEMLQDLLLSPNSRTRPLLNVALLRRWLDMFRRARSGQRDGTISREGLYQCIFVILALEVWMRRHRLSW
jgi:asparagine synthase (glutamine-hydrolysing)